MPDPFELLNEWKHWTMEEYKLALAAIHSLWMLSMKIVPTHEAPQAPIKYHRQVYSA